MTCARCQCIRAALMEVGLDPERAMCADDMSALRQCLVGAGMGFEGKPLEEIDRMTDRAIEICLDLPAVCKDCEADRG